MGWVSMPTGMGSIWTRGSMAAGGPGDRGGGTGGEGQRRGDSGHANAGFYRRSNRAGLYLHNRSTDIQEMTGRAAHLSPGRVRWE